MIYNIRGHKVKTISDGFMNVGRHSVIWNGTDENNLQVGSGIYFYRMTTEEYTFTRRMVLLK